jgi:hypothetical protein
MPTPRSAARRSRPVPTDGTQGHGGRLGAAGGSVRERGVCRPTRDSVGAANDHAVLLVLDCGVVTATEANARCRRRTVDREPPAGPRGIAGYVARPDWVQPPARSAGHSIPISAFALARRRLLGPTKINRRRSAVGEVTRCPTHPFADASGRSPYSAGKAATQPDTPPKHCTHPRAVAQARSLTGLDSRAT